MQRVLVALALVLALAPLHAQVRLADESDRAAFRLWFTFLADAEFYRPTADVTDCAALVRHAFREALRAHTPEWVRQYGLGLTPGYPDVRRPVRAGSEGWPLFRVAPGRYAEFADARTLVGLNARLVGRDPRAARPGDLLYFQQPGQRSPDHVMVFVGRSLFDRAADDWVVYHTGPDGGGPGEVRKLRLAELERHPSARWRPVPINPRFQGVFRLAIL
jgi:uncharacterized protein YfaT (DUF1175 family)